MQTDCVYVARFICLQSSSVESDGLVNTIKSVRLESLCLTLLWLSHSQLFTLSPLALPSPSSPSTPAANPIWWQCLSHSNPEKNVFGILAIEKKSQLTWTERAERRRSGEKRDGGVLREGGLADWREPSSPTLGYEIRAQIESKGVGEVTEGERKEERK